MPLLICCEPIHVSAVFWLLFTHHYPARCFGMNMPKSRDIHAKIPLPEAILLNFGIVSVKILNRYYDKIRLQNGRNRRKRWKIRKSLIYFGKGKNGR